MRLVPNEQVLHPAGRWGVYGRNLLRPRPELAPAFEGAISQRLGGPHTLATRSGKAALHLILRALALPDGTEALVPAYTYYGLADIVRAAGIVPRFVDVDPASGGMNFRHAVAAWRPAVRLVLHTHLFGVINRGAAEAGRAIGAQTWLVEDGAHAPTYFAPPDDVAAWKGYAAFLSFDRLKLVQSMRGGMVVTRNDELASRARAIVAAFPETSRTNLLSLIAFYELESFVRRPSAYAAAGRLLGSPRAMDLVRRIFRRANRNIVGDDRRFSPLQAELGLRSLTGLDQRATARRESIRAILDRLRALASGAAAQTYVAALARTFDAPGPAATCFVVCVDEPPAVQRAARAMGFETLIGDRITQLCSPPEPEAFPGAHHLLRHAVKLPLPDDVPDDRFRRFVDRIAPLLAGSLAPYCNPAE